MMRIILVLIGVLLPRLSESVQSSWDERQLRWRIRHVKHLIELAQPPHCNEGPGCAPQQVYLESELRGLYRMLYNRSQMIDERGIRPRIAIYASSTAAARGPISIHSNQSSLEKNPLFFFFDRCVAAYQTWGRELYRYYCVLPSHAAILGYARSQGCDKILYEEDTTLFREILEYDCARVDDGPRLLLTTCSSQYRPGSAGAPCCAMNSALRHALFISIVYNTTDWYLFADDDEYFRPRNLFRLLDQFEPWRPLALTSKGLTVGIFDNVVFGCDDIVRHVWTQPLILSRAAFTTTILGYPSSLRDAIQTSALVTVCHDFDIFQDVAGGIVLWETGIDIYAVNCCFNNIHEDLALDDIGVHGARTMYNKKRGDMLRQEYKSHYELHDFFNELEYNYTLQAKALPMRYLQSPRLAFSYDSAYTRTPHASYNHISHTNSSSFRTFTPFDCIITCDYHVKHRISTQMPKCDIERHRTIHNLEGGALLKPLKIYTEAIRDHGTSGASVLAANDLLRKAQEHFAQKDSGRQSDRVKLILSEAKAVLASASS